MCFTRLQTESKPISNMVFDLFTIGLDIMETIAEMMLQFTVFKKRPDNENIGRILDICSTFPRVEIPIYESNDSIKQQYISFMKSAVHYGMKEYLLLTLVIAHEQFLSFYSSKIEICTELTALFDDILSFALTL